MSQADRHGHRPKTRLSLAADPTQPDLDEGWTAETGDDVAWETEEEWQARIDAEEKALQAEQAAQEQADADAAQEQADAAAAPRQSRTPPRSRRRSRTRRPGRPRRTSTSTTSSTTKLCTSPPTPRLRCT